MVSLGRKSTGILPSNDPQPKSKIELEAELANIDFQLQNITLVFSSLDQSQRVVALERATELLASRRRLQGKFEEIH